MFEKKKKTMAASGVTMKKTMTTMCHRLLMWRCYYREKEGSDNCRRLLLGVLQRRRRR